MNIRPDIAEIASHFAFGKRPVSYEELNEGLINTTYRLLFSDDDTDNSYILQRINTVAFKDPDSLMHNIFLVTEHIRAGLEREGVDPNRHVLNFVRTNDGERLYRDAEGGCWRAYCYVGRATAYNVIENPRMFREAGRGFGEFQTRLLDFPADRLVESIPHFHDTPRRYQALCDAIRADKAGRVKDLGEEIAFVNARVDRMGEIVDRLATGELPLRVTHNDTKLNNVLLDDETDRALCVIDLDTVMPGSVLYDFGDAIRYGANTVAEDEVDTDKVGFDMELFEAFTRGFLEETAGNLTASELHLLPLGAEIMTLELVIRFLTDYVEGDVYFKTKYPGHNLVRTHAQMRLLTEMEKRMGDMYAFVDGSLRK